MKVAKNVIFGLVVTGVMVFVSGVSFAETATSAPAATPAAAANDVSAAKKARHEARIKLLHDSAAALQATHPDLAKGLMDMTVPKQKTEMQKVVKEKNEKEEAGEKVEPKSEQGEVK